MNSEKIYGQMANINGLKDFIFKLCSVASVSGFEKRATAELLKLTENMLDAPKVDNVGNHLFVKRCNRKDAPRILLDAHLDEIGMIVTEVCEDGFLRVAPLGGIDPSILQAADVIIYGKEKLRGVIASTPPHLKKTDELPDPAEVIVDTGLSGKRARELITVGTPVGFSPVYRELMGGRLVGKSFDDKACAACLLWALAYTPTDELAGDVYLLLSSVEETNRIGGVSAAAFSVDPDYAMVVDVNLARVPSTEDFETVELDGGVSLSVSAATDIGLTRDVQSLCEEKDISHCMIAAPASTGTNATSLNLTRCGVPVVDVGLPLASMHTYNEVITVKDAQTLVSLVGEFIRSESIAKKYARTEDGAI